MKLILITLFSSVTMPPTESTTLSPGIIAASVILLLVIIAVVGTSASFLVCSSSAWKKLKWLSCGLRDCEQQDFKLESQEQVKVEPQWQQLDDFSDTHPPTPDNRNLREEMMSIDSRDIAILLDNPVSPTENVTLTNVLETPPSHVTATKTDQYTKDNELHPMKTSVAIAIEGEDHQNSAGRNSGEIFQATPQPENPFLPRYSADPYNTAQYIPKWMKPVATLTDCTSDGRSYYDEHNDFRLEIPEGAIPEGERVIIDIGVALYGPFQYLTGLRPVSPVFWVCVRGQENFRFLKPVKITIEHCLRLDRDTDTHSLGLIFLKAGHTLNSAGKYELHSADGAHDFQSDLSHGTLTTDHFCLLCIEAKDDHETAKRNGYFLIRAHVDPIPARGIHAMEFFVTLKLKCCVDTVKFQCKDKGYSFFYGSFHLNLNKDSHGSLTINYEEPEKMWTICLQSPKKVSILDYVIAINMK